MSKQQRTKKVICGNCGGEGVIIVPRYGDAGGHSLDASVWKPTHCQACEGTGYIIITVND